MTKVSIIIPAYNSLSFLPRTLKSVFNQTFQDYEVIIVNDGSSDGIEQWAEQITDSRLKLISQENQGQSTARNTGITHAQGEYIAFLDSDDLWEPTKLEKQVQVLERNPGVGLVHTWVALIDEGNQFLGKVWRSDLEENAWAKLIDGNTIACGSVPMVRRCCLETVGLFQRFPFACEDWDMWLRIAACYQFKVIKEILVYYRASSASLSRSKVNDPVKKLKDIEQSYQHILEKAFDSAPPHLQPLKGRSFALANLQIAWKALNSFDSCEYAEYFRQQAIYNYPPVVFLPTYKRLINAIFIVQLAGFRLYTSYKKVKNFIRSLNYKNYKVRDYLLKQAIGS